MRTDAGTYQTGSRTFCTTFASAIGRRPALRANADRMRRDFRRGRLGRSRCAVLGREIVETHRGHVDHDALARHLRQARTAWADRPASPRPAAIDRRRDLRAHLLVADIEAAADRRERVLVACEQHLRFADELLARSERDRACVERREARRLRIGRGRNDRAPERRLRRPAARRNRRARRAPSRARPTERERARLECEQQRGATSRGVYRSARERAPGSVAVRRQIQIAGALARLADQTLSRREAHLRETACDRRARFDRRQNADAATVV